MGNNLLSLTQKFELEKLKRDSIYLDKQQVIELLKSATQQFKIKQNTLVTFHKERKLNLELDSHEMFQLQVAYNDYKQFSLEDLKTMLLSVIFNTMLLNNALVKVFSGVYDCVD